MENAASFWPAWTSAASARPSKLDVVYDAARTLLKDQTVKVQSQSQFVDRRQAFGDLTNSGRQQQGHGLPTPAVLEGKLGKGLTVGAKLAVSKQHAAGADRSNPVRDWGDVDKHNEEDPQACSAYAASIMQHLRDTEQSKMANPRYLELVQRDVNPKMRAILIDWLVEVSEEYRLCADTLYQAVNYIDRFLSLHVAQRSQLQLVGVTCMWLAAKYEEIYPPNVADFCYITDNTYSKEQLVQMEETILKTLQYELTIPTAKTFLRRLLQVCNPDELLHYLSNYLTELSLLDYSMLNFPPSFIAGAGVYLANLMLKRRPWDANLRHYSTYAPGELGQCIIALAAVHQAVSTSQHLAAIRDKYGHAKFHQVSTIPPICVTSYMLG